MRPRIGNTTFDRRVYEYTEMILHSGIFRLDRGSFSSFGLIAVGLLRPLLRFSRSDPIRFHRIWLLLFFFERLDEAGISHYKADRHCDRRLLVYSY